MVGRDVVRIVVDEVDVHQKRTHHTYTGHTHRLLGERGESTLAFW